MRKSTYPKQATKILNRQAGSSLQPLLSYANYLQRQNKLLRSSLSEPVASHVTLANIRNGTAMMVVSSSTWLGKIRYLAPIIQQILTKQGLIINRVEFKVDPNHLSGRKIVSKPALMSVATGKLLHDFSENINNPKLQAALQRLAKHGKEK